MIFGDGMAKIPRKLFVLPSFLCQNTGYVKSEGGSDAKP
jgi:hypothetical protein